MSETDKSPKLPETEWEEYITVACRKEFHPAQGMNDYAYIKLPIDWDDCEVVAYRIRITKRDVSKEEE